MGLLELEYEVGIIGGGPGGCVAACTLKNAGIDSICLFEGASFPRFQIGESLLPASMPILDRIGFLPRLQTGKYLHKYGARFLAEDTNREIYFNFLESGKKELEYAFEVPRLEFDSDLMDYTKSLGVSVYQPERVEKIEEREDFVIVQTNERKLKVKYVLDASGRNSFVANKNGGRKLNPEFNNLGIFGHFENVERYSGKSEGDITITILGDRAWSWVIPFQGNLSSVGVVFTSNNFKSEEIKDDHLFYQLVDRCQSLSNKMKDAKKIGQLRKISNYSQSSESIIGDRWISIGDAAAFLDPIFSSGVHLSISSAEVAANIIIESLRNNQSLALKSEVYEETLKRGMNRFGSMIGMFYDGKFLDQMLKVLDRPHLYRWFTAVVAGDVWDEENPLFQKGVL